LNGRSTSPAPLKARANCRRNWQGVAVEALEFPFDVAEHLTCLTAPDIFDHLVKSGCANIGGHARRPMQDFTNGVQR
jgi:hypothetical protein